MSSTPYDRQNSFALFSAENPTEQQSGAQLDTEFNAVKVAIDDTQQNLAKIQDDDGVLKRGSVGQAQFDASVSLGFSAPAQWAPNTAYTANVNTVFYLSIFYIAKTTHTSGVSFDATKWTLIADLSAAAAIPDGSITSAKLASNSVAPAAIQSGAISNTKIATGAVDDTKIADSTITYTKFLTSDIAAPLAALLIPAGLGPLPWPMQTLPVGWDWADGGVLLSNTPYPALRAALIANGFLHGQDGSGNPFKPDARGRALFGSDQPPGGSAAGRISTATLSGAVNGGHGGSEQVTLTTPQIPTHNHTLTDPGHVHTQNISPSGGSPGGFVQANVSQVYASSGINTFSNTTGITLASAGSGTAHSNMPPALVCNMIIKAH